MSNERLNGLTLLSVHYDLPLNLGTIIDLYVRKQPKCLELILKVCHCFWLLAATLLSIVSCTCCRALLWTHLFSNSFLLKFVFIKNLTVASIYIAFFFSCVQVLCLGKPCVHGVTHWHPGISLHVNLFAQLHILVVNNCSILDVRIHLFFIWAGCLRQKFSRGAAPGPLRGPRQPPEPPASLCYSEQVTLDPLLQTDVKNK